MALDIGPLEASIMSHPSEKSYMLVFSFRKFGTAFHTGILFSERLSNPFHVNVPSLYSLKTSENLWFTEVFIGYRNGTLA